MFTKVMGLRGQQEDVPDWLKKALSCSRLLSATRHHQDLKLLVSRWNCESHTLCCYFEELTPTLEDVARLTMLSCLVKPTLWDCPGGGRSCEAEVPDCCDDLFEDV